MPFDFSEDIQPVTEFRNRTNEFLESLKEKRTIILTQHGKATAVLESVQEFQRREEELRFLKGLFAGLQDLDNGFVVEGEEELKKIKESLKNKS